MTQEEINLLLKDLCARLPYGVIVNVKGFYYDFNSKLTQIYKGYGCSIQVTNNMPYGIDQVKPYLFPMSSITEEQTEELIKLINTGQNNNNELMRSLCRIEFYHKHHIDYRGLISMGHAIDATGLNIY